MTLVTEKSVKLLYTCARGRAKKHFSIYYYHTFGENDESSKSPLLLSSSSEITSSKTSSSTDVAFSHKQRVVFLQTTCRFPSNNVSYSLKQRVVFSQTTCRFLSSAMSKFINSYLRLLYGIVGCSAVIEGRSNSIGCYGLCSIKR